VYPLELIANKGGKQGPWQDTYYDIAIPNRNNSDHHSDQSLYCINHDSYDGEPIVERQVNRRQSKRIVINPNDRADENSDSEIEAEIEAAAGRPWRHGSI
jgi:hypothetical protein